MIRQQVQPLPRARPGLSWPDGSHSPPLLSFISWLLLSAVLGTGSHEAEPGSMLMPSGGRWGVPPTLHAVLPGVALQVPASDSTPASFCFMGSPIQTCLLRAGSWFYPCFKTQHPNDTSLK